MAEIPMGCAIGWLAEKAPRRPFITDPKTTVSRREFDLRTNRKARWFAGLGVRQDTMVTVGLPNGIGFYEACAAAWKLGATPQPLSSRLPFPEQQDILELADPALVVGDSFDWITDRPVVSSGQSPPAGLDDSPLPPRAAQHWKAPTSGGSTGRPKLIVAGTASVVDPSVPAGFEMPTDATQLVGGPLYHNGPFIYSMRGLLTGGHLVVMERFDPGAWLQLIRRHAVEWALLVPTQMGRIWRLGAKIREESDVSSLHTVLHLGAPCPPWLKRAWLDWLGPDRLFEMYAGTEGIAATWITGDEWLQRPGSVGRALYGQFSVRDDNGAMLPPGTIGEIWLRRPPGATPTFHYVGTKTRVLDGGWQSLGDLGWMDDDNYVYLSDRRADLILRGAANVYPAEVEAALSEHPAVLSCAVIGLEDEDLGQQVHAVIQAESDVSAAELRAHMETRLAAYKIPRTFEFTSEALRDAAGKVHRAALRRDRG